MPWDRHNPGVLVWRLFCLAVAAAGLGGSTYFIGISRVPIVLAFIPMGQVTRDDNPIIFWLIITSGLILGVLGLVGLFRRIGSSNESDPDE